MQELDQLIKGDIRSATHTAIQGVMPHLHIIVGSYGLAIYAPVLWGEHGTVDPVVLDVFHEFFQGLRGCFHMQSLENAGNLLVRDEGEGHQSPDVAVGPLVADVCARQTKRLNL